MITKDNLIDMLEKSKANEDEFIAIFGESFLKNVIKAQILNEDEKKEIKNLLTGLLGDTERHRKTIAMLIEKIKGDRRNEF